MWKRKPSTDDMYEGGQKLLYTDIHKHYDKAGGKQEHDKALLLFIQ